MIDIEMRKSITQMSVISFYFCLTAFNQEEDLAIFKIFRL